MVMIATDELTDGVLVYLPPEAGDSSAPFFEPVDEWLVQAPPIEQKTAMWQWFATRHEQLRTSTPHDQDGEYFFGMKEPPVRADDVLRERFSGVVDASVLEQLIAAVQEKAGEVWAKVEPDKLSS